MNILDIFRISIGALWDRRTRTALTILMVVVGAGLIVSLNGLASGFSVFIDRQFSTLSPNMLIVTPSSQFSGGRGGDSGERMELDATTVKNLRTLRGVKEVVPVILKSVQFTSGGTSTNLQVIGVDQTRLEILFPTFKVEEGRRVFPNDSVGLLLGDEVKNPPGRVTPFAQVGHRVTMTYATVETDGDEQKRVTEKKSFLVRGVANPIGTGFFFPIDTGVSITLTEANSFFNMKGKYSMILVATDDVDLNDVVQEAIQNIYGDNIGVSSPQAIVGTIQGFVTGFTGFILAIAAVSLIVGGVGIITSLITSVMERTREIGLLKALGFKGRTILSLFLTEAILIGTMGGIIGITIGIVFGTFAFPLIAPGPPNAAIEAVFEPQALVTVFLLVTGLSALAGIYPAWRASRLDPIVALRKE